MRTKTKPPTGLVVREALPADNDALIALELQSPLVVDDAEEKYDRSPDFFACHRVQAEHRVVLAELEGRLVGVMAGVIQTPTIEGRPRRLVYIQRGRVHPAYQGRGVAWLLANDLFVWSRNYGAEGPYYLIAPGNERSIAFGGRVGRRWPVDLRLMVFDASGRESGILANVDATRLSEVVAAVNSTHAGEEFFEPLTVASLTERMARDTQFGPRDLYGIVDEGRLAAVAGLWDKGATTEQIHSDQGVGSVARTRGTVVVDWGWAPGQVAVFARLLRLLAAKSHGLGRQAMTVCEPRPGMIPDIGLPRHEVRLNLYTPTIDPPSPDNIRGLFADLLTV